MTHNKRGTSRKDRQSFFYSGETNATHKNNKIVHNTQKKQRSFSTNDITIIELLSAKVVKGKRHNKSRKKRRHSTTY